MPKSRKHSKFQQTTNGHADNGTAACNEFVEQINASWQEREAALAKAAEHTIETGQTLIRAKEELKHGQFQKMIKNDLRFGPRMAQILMVIAAHPVISNAKWISHLPPHVATLYAMATKIPEEALERSFADGTINAETNGKDVDELATKFREDGVWSANKLYEALHYLIRLTSKDGPSLAWVVQKLMDLYGEQDGVSVKELGELWGYLKEFHRAYEEKATEFDASFKEEDEAWEAARPKDNEEVEEDDHRDKARPPVRRERVKLQEHGRP